MMQAVQQKLTELTLRDGKPIPLQPLPKCLRLTAINLFHGLLLLGISPSHGCGKQFSIDLLQCLLGGFKYAGIEEIKQAAASCAANPELIDKSADTFLVRLFREETLRIDTGGSENAHDSIHQSQEDHREPTEEHSYENPNGASPNSRWDVIRQFSQQDDPSKVPLDAVIRLLTDSLRRTKLPCRLVFLPSVKKSYTKSTGLEAFNRKATGQPKAKAIFETDGIPKIVISVIEKDRKEFHLRFGVIRFKDDPIGSNLQTISYANNSAYSSHKKTEQSRNEVLSKVNKNLILIDDIPDDAPDSRGSQPQIGMIRQTSSKDYGGRIDTQAKKLINDFMQKIKPAQIGNKDLVAQEPESLKIPKNTQHRQLSDIDPSKLNSKDQLLGNSDAKSQTAGANEKPKTLSIALQMVKQHNGKADSGAKTSGRVTDSAFLVTSFQPPIHPLYANHSRRQDLQQNSSLNSVNLQRAVGKSLDEPKSNLGSSISQRIGKLIPTLDVNQLRHSLEVASKVNPKGGTVVKPNEPRSKLASTRLAETENKAQEQVVHSNKNSARSPKGQIGVNVYMSPLGTGAKKASDAPNSARRELAGKTDQQTPEHSQKLLEQLKHEGADPVTLHEAASLKLAGLTKYLRKDVNHQRKKSRPEPAFVGSFSGLQNAVPKPSLTARDKPATQTSSGVQSHIVSQPSPLLTGLSENKPLKQESPLINKVVAGTASFMNLYYKQANFDTIQEDAEPKSTLSVDLVKNESFEAIKLEDLNPVEVLLTPEPKIAKYLNRESAGVKVLKTKFKSLLIGSEQTHLDSIFPVPRKAQPTPANTSEADISAQLKSPKKKMSQMLDSFEEEHTDRDTCQRKASEQISVDPLNQSKVNSSGASWKHTLIPKQQNEHFIKNLKNYSPSQETSAKKIDSSMRRYAKKANSKDGIKVEVKQESLSNKAEPMFVHKKPSLNNIVPKQNKTDPIYQSSIGAVEYTEVGIPRSDLLSSGNAQQRLAYKTIQSLTAPTTPRNTPSDPSKMASPSNPTLPWILTNESGQQLVGIIGQPLLMSNIQPSQNGTIGELKDQMLGITYIPMNQIFIPTLTRSPMILGFFPNPNNLSPSVLDTSQKTEEAASQNIHKDSAKGVTTVPAEHPIQEEDKFISSASETQGVIEKKGSPQPDSIPKETSNADNSAIKTRLWSAQQRILLSLTNMTGLMLEHSARIRSSLLPDRPNEPLTSAVAIAIESASQNKIPAFNWLIPTALQAEEKMHRIPMSRIDDFNARSVSRGIIHDRAPHHPSSIGPSQGGELHQLLKHAKSKTELYKQTEIIRDISAGTTDFPIYAPQTNLHLPVVPQLDQYPVVSKYYIGSNTFGIHDAESTRLDRLRGAPTVQIRSVSSSANRLVVQAAVSVDQSQPSIYSSNPSSNLQGFSSTHQPIYGGLSSQPAHHQQNFPPTTSLSRPQH